MDSLSSKLMFLTTIFTSLIVVAIALVLLQRSSLIISTRSISNLLLSSMWLPRQGEFGFQAFIAGTLWVTGLAMVLSIPPSLLMSVYLVEYAPVRIRGFITPLVDLLAGVPSVVWGLWGVLLIVPMIRDYVAPMVGVTSSGYTVLAGGIVLAIMVSPVMIAVSGEVIKAVPKEMREASLAVGATKWQTVKHVVLRASSTGIIAAIILGFGRAFGETMAVLMVVGNVPKAPTSILDPAYPIPALIANDYGEMLTIPTYDSALMFAALLLLLVVLGFSLLAAILLYGIKRRYTVGQKKA